MKPGPPIKRLDMKCNAGIWIDCKQMLEHTNRLVRSFNEFDREVVGKELIRLNVALVRDFAMAYRLRDEHYVYDDAKTIRDFTVSGHKREYLDKFIGDLQAYEALIEFSFENLEFIGPKNKRKRKRRERFFLTQLGKIEQGVEKWNRKVYKQVILSEFQRGES